MVAAPWHCDYLGGLCGLLLGSIRCLELCGHCRGFHVQGSLVQSSFESTRLRHAPDTGETKGKELITGKGPIALPHRPDEDSHHQEPESNEEEQEQVLLDDSQDMIGAIRGRGFVVGTAEFGTRLKCGSDRSPTLLLDSVIIVQQGLANCH